MAYSEPYCQVNDAMARGDSCFDHLHFQLRVSGLISFLHVKCWLFDLLNCTIKPFREKEEEAGERDVIKMHVPTHAQKPLCSNLYVPSQASFIPVLVVRCRFEFIGHPLNMIPIISF